VFSQDLTVAGRQAAEDKKQRKNEPNENVAPETLVPVLLIPDGGTEGVEEAEPKVGEEGKTGQLCH
jgi:hypothetical protein